MSTPPAGLDYNTFRTWRKNNNIKGTPKQISAAWQVYSASGVSKTKKSTPRKSVSPPKKITPPKKTSTGKRGRPKKTIPPKKAASPPKSRKKSPNKSPTKTTIKISSGSNSIAGRRFRNEDTFIEFPNIMKDISLFAVFDGHGGSDTAEYLQKHFGEILITFFNTYPIPVADLIANPKEHSEDIEDELRDVFKAMDEVILKKNFNSGSTAVIALVIKNIVYLAWIGDSRGIVVRNGKVVLSTEDHKPNLPREEARIKAAGGHIFSLPTFMGTEIWRVAGALGLATSRSFGDAPDKELIISTPDIVSTELQPGDTIVLACDGIWDVLSNERVAAIVTDNPLHLKDVASNINKMAYDADSQDNLTALVIKV